MRPGRYTLFATGGNQFEDFRREDVVVTAGDNPLGTLEWRPVSHGRTLWQIGRPDRSTQEFAHGLDYRHYTNYLRYAENFPDDVTFTVGKSREDRDWNFANAGLGDRWPACQKRSSASYDPTPNFYGQIRQQLTVPWGIAPSRGRTRPSLTAWSHAFSLWAGTRRR